MAETKKFDGKWVIPMITGAGSIFFGVKSWIASHSGSQIKQPDGSYVDSDVNVSFWDTGYCWFFAGLLLATIAIYFAMKSEK